LENTRFFALNTLACDSTNAALYNTMNDPGDQLLELEKFLFSSR